jgi:uncharacterized protein (DUF1499 family)
VAAGLAALGCALGIAALLALAAGPVGWRAGWWHYRIGLQVLMPGAGIVGAAAVAASLAALSFGFRSIARRGVVVALLGLVIGGAAAYFPWYWSDRLGSFPQVNDVTTDADDPPSLAFAAAARRAEQGNPAAYAGAEPATVQRQTYPDIMPAVLDVPRAAAFDRALSVARAKGWTVVRSDPAAGVIEAADRSRWFGFIDDIAVRVRAAGGGSRVDIRSSARQGRGDFGVNARRVQDFLAAVKAPAR